MAPVVIKHGNYMRLRFWGDKRPGGHQRAVSSPVGPSGLLAVSTARGCVNLSSAL